MAHRLSLPLLVLLASCASGSSAMRTKSHAPRARTAKAPPRLTGSAEVRFRDRRAEVAKLATEWSSLRLVTLGAGLEDEEVVDLPLTEKASTVDTLVIIAVFDGYARVGATRVTSEPEIRAAAASFASSSRPVALLRVDDEAHLSDVIRTARAVRSAGLDVRVLGSISPDEAPPARKWDACPFPAEADYSSVDSATVFVKVDEDGTGHPGVIHVLRAPGLGFPWAAAVCASQQAYDRATEPLGKPRFGQPLGIHFTR